MTPDIYPPLTGLLAAPGAGARLILHASPANKATAGASPASHRPTTAAAKPRHAQYRSIGVTDWDLLFDAIEIRLQNTVGAHLGTLPETPAHSAQLAASLVQASVLDCVDALHKLHAAIKDERSQRPTA